MIRALSASAVCKFRRHLLDLAEALFNEGSATHNAITKGRMKLTAVYNFFTQVSHRVTFLIDILAFILINVIFLV